MNDFGEIYGPDGRQILVSGVALPCGDHSKAGETMANGQLFFAALAMLEALKAVEWSRGDGMTINRYCPICRQEKRSGHSPKCQLGNALRAARGEK